MVIEPNSGSKPTTAATQPGPSGTDSTRGKGNVGKTDVSANKPVVEGLDSVSLSQEAQTLTRLEAKIHAASDSDAERIASIKRAIDDGSFEINAARIAENLLNQDNFFA